MSIYTLILLVAVVSARALCRRKIWYEYQKAYRILNYIEDHIVIISGILIVAGWLFIFILYVRKALLFLDEIVLEAKKLVAHEDGQITLSPELISVQNDFNSLRENAIRSKTAARDAEQRKNDLIVYLAHDLKTPLTSIIGYLTLLNEEPDLSTSAKAKYTGIALDKAIRLEELINEFFEITRFNLTSITLETETINFTRLIEQTAYEFKPVLDEKELVLNMSLEKDLMLVVDADKLARVVDNLIKNAINYSYPRTAITLTSKRNNSTALFCVENKGKTIPKDKLDRIFEQFFRLDTSRGTKSGGAGLGLAIAKEIVQLHGGVISAYSENETIRFTVELPL